jgi:hypothetical protein
MGDKIIVLHDENAPPRPGIDSRIADVPGFIIPNHLNSQRLHEGTPSQCPQACYGPNLAKL